MCFVYLVHVYIHINFNHSTSFTLSSLTMQWLVQLTASLLYTMDLQDQYHVCTETEFVGLHVHLNCMMHGAALTLYTDILGIASYL